MIVGVEIDFVSQAFNSRFCRVIENKQATDYTPYQVTEYAINDRKFMATDIDLRGKRERVFLEQLAEGKATLYYYEDSLTKLYLVEKQKGTLIPVPEYDRKTRGAAFYEHIAALTSDNAYISKNSVLVRPDRFYMIRFIEKYNATKRGYLAIPMAGVAVSVGEISMVAVNTSDETALNSVKYEKKNNVAYEAFFEYPILAHSFSFYTLIRFSGFSDSYSNEGLRTFPNNPSENYYIYQDVVYKTSMVQVPVFVKYSVPIRVVTPYAFLGGGINVINQFYDVYISKRQGVEISLESYNRIEERNKIQKMCAAGFGLQYRFRPGNTLFIEYRKVWNNVFPYSSRPDFAPVEQRIVTGISFKL
jgi:hypothetical protein